MVDLPGVGRRLMDHPMTPMAFHARPGVADPTKPLTQTLLRYTAEGGEFNDMQVYLLGHVAGEFGVGDDAIAIAPGVQLPNSFGAITLASTDYHDHPQIDVSFDENEEDRRRLREGARLAWRLANEPALSQYHDGAIDFDEATANDDELLDAWIHTTCTSMAHPTCTCAMGASAEEGAVVDPRRPSLRRRRSARRRRFDHAHADPRQHQLHQHGDRRPHRRVDVGGLGRKISEPRILDRFRDLHDAGERRRDLVVDAL